MSTSTKKTKTQRIEELETEVKALRALVESQQTLISTHIWHGHAQPMVTPPPWIDTPKPMWQQPYQITCGDPAGTIGHGVITS